MGDAVLCRRISGPRSAANLIGWSSLNQIKLTEAERDALLAVQQTASPPPAGGCCSLQGHRRRFAAVLWLEGLFRQFDDRRQLAAYAGLAPDALAEQLIDREQGVSKAGNARLRTTPFNSLGCGRAINRNRAIALVP